MTTMSAATRHKPPAAANGETPVLRVALYTRKSSDKGLDQRYNSIDAQRLLLEEFVARHQDEGWVALPDRYDDGGFTGGNTNRPAFQRLLKDIKAGHIDRVAVYRLDRLSRHTGNFDALLDLFRQHGVEAVSPNERIDHATAGDRFTLGVRMQVCQYEREIAAERIRDKMRSARKQGFWQGGRPVLGYDVVAKKLEVNETEAAEVRTIFETYLRLHSLVATLQELARRGIRNKSWTTQKGRARQGAAFDVNTLRRLLGNPLYVGKLHAGDEVVTAEHKPIVPPATFEAAQRLLAEKRTERPRAYKPSGALLQGLLRCARCGGGMVPHYTAAGPKRHGYYVCAKQKRHGAAACPGTRAPAGPMEAFVVDQIRAIGKDPGLVADTVAATRAEVEARAAERAADLGRCGTEAARLRREHEALVQAVVQGGTSAPSLIARSEAAHEAAEQAESRLNAARAEQAALRSCTINEADLRRALGTFEVWDALFPAERARILHLLLDRVVYDAQAEKVDITFRPGGVSELARAEEAP